MSFTEWWSNGLLDLSIPALIAVCVITTHITVVAVTLYLHRCSSHRALWLHPAVSHFFRMWLWLGTGMNTKEWTAIHRKHHADCETEEDPHSPVQQGLSKILWDQAGAYRVAATKPEIIERYGAGTPDDWMERNVYSLGSLGVVITLVLNLALFGIIGLTVWAIQMMWVPVVGGIINGIGHWWGYRNYECPDAARNIVPWGIIIGGEELHNNHHTYANSAKLSSKPWEFDIGWMYIRILGWFGLARPLATGPVAVQGEQRPLDKDTAIALINDRFDVMARYAREVIAPVVAEQRAAASGASKSAMKRAQKLLRREDSLLDDSARARLQDLVQVPELKTVYEFRMRLQSIWEQRAGDMETVVQSLREWCAEAEASGHKVLADFVEELKCYTMPQMKPQTA